MAKGDLKRMRDEGAEPLEDKAGPGQMELDSQPTTDLLSICGGPEDHGTVSTSGMQRDDAVTASINENVEYNMLSNDGSMAHELDIDRPSNEATINEKGPEPHEDGDGFGGIDGRVRPEATTTGSPGGPEGHSIHDSTEAPSALSAVTDPSPGEEAYMNVVNDGSTPAYMDAMEENAQKAEVSGKHRKNAEQRNLEGKKAIWPLSGKIKIPDPRFELETSAWKLKGNKMVVSTLVELGNRLEVQKIVQKGLRINDDQVHPDGEFDEAVERFTDEIMHGIIDLLPGGE